MNAHDVGPLLSGKTMLVVEDSEATILFYQRSLARSGVKMEVARSLAEARMVIASNVYFDIVILDVELPDGNGYSLKDHFKRMSSAVAICTADPSRKTLLSMDVEIWDKSTSLGMSLMTKLIELLNANEMTKSDINKSEEKARRRR